MAGPLNAKVIVSRCSKTKKTFGIRIEKRGQDWVRTWAFPLDEGKAKREAFNANTVTGSMEPVDNFPGCPYCGSMGMVKCGCEKTGCSGGVRDCDDYEEYTCPWCGGKAALAAADSLDVSGGGY